jgi:tRNA1(Val) A37 N6-methylase TrmN6
VSPHPGRALATKETNADLQRWLKIGHDALVHKGYLTVVHRADRLTELIKILPLNFGGVSILPLWPHQKEEAKRVIIQLRKGTRSPTRILPGLSIHNADGTYRDAATRVLNGAAIEI